MRQSLAILSALSSLALAADTIQFFFPQGGEGVDPVATIQDVKASTTKFNIACPTNVNESECGWGPGLDYTIISSTRYGASLSMDSYTMSFACEHNTQRQDMTCTAAANMEESSMVTDTVTLTGSEVFFNKATIVQGASLLTGASAASTAVSSGSTPASAPSSGLLVDNSPSATGSPSGLQGPSSGGSGTPTGSGVPAENTGAAPRTVVGGVALFAVAGAAALFAY